eukprot:TRINITY_DN48149_c0_g1_i1.p1 TRINITY_DN48149_c0_g1~~TRINITY_DN48149_c0_g1_i1.p1  ORF type:complete len:405 (+),score=91.21 TRINITY_DN48149_c0_g1_i1:99-1313(+)
MRKVPILALAATAAAFDIDAHDAVGQTCASAMDQSAIKQVKRLLGGQDASDVAGWGHEVDDTYPGMAQLHFQIHDDEAQPWCGPAENRVAKCKDNICLLEAIKHFYGKVLSDEGRRIDYPKIDIQSIAQGLRFSDADSVKMLINLIGDLHQPMHVGFAGDNTGRNIQVRFRGNTETLYDMWDKVISEAVRTHESNFWLGGWTHVRAVSSEFAEDKQLWKQDGAFKSFERWLGETVNFACQKAYVHPTTGQRITAGSVVDIDEDAYQVWRELWLKQILIAGERTAIVLNDILDAAAAAKLSAASGVKTEADKGRDDEQEQWEKARQEREKQETKRKSTSAKVPWNSSIFLKNLIIAAITVPLFLAFAHHGLDPRNVQAAVQSLLEPPKQPVTGSGGGGTQGRRSD